MYILIGNRGRRAARRDFEDSNFSNMEEEFLFSIHTLFVHFVHHPLLFYFPQQPNRPKIKLKLFTVYTTYNYYSHPLLNSYILE